MNDLYSRILSELVEECSRSVRLIFINLGEVKVVPICIKGKQDKPCNYRPVSQTLIMGKILERLIHDTRTITDAEHLIRWAQLNILLNTAKCKVIQVREC